jgi:cytochrome c
MKRLLPLLSLGIALLLPPLAWAGDQATPDEAKAMAIKAAAYLKSAGPDKAFAEFDATTGPWQDRDLYVIVFDTHGVAMARGNNPGLIGKSLIELKDVDGKPFMREIVAVSDVGWVNYKWQNPVTKAVQEKTSYVVRAGDYLIAVGAYTK